MDPMYDPGAPRIGDKIFNDVCYGIRLGLWGWTVQKFSFPPMQTLEIEHFGWFGRKRAQEAFTRVVATELATRALGLGRNFTCHGYLMASTNEMHCPFCLVLWDPRDSAPCSRGITVMDHLV